MKESIFSFFNAPITNQVPNGVVCVSQLHAYITTSEWLRERTDQVRAASGDEKRFRRLKQSLLPYVTPAGIFSYRKEDHLLVPSGEPDASGRRRPTAVEGSEFVIDIDHISSSEEAIRWRDTLFADERLRPDLSFVSPSTTGIKLLVPYRLSIKKTVEESFDEAVRFAWEYLEGKYGLKADATNADLSRACFLCHDPSARLREN